MTLKPTPTSMPPTTCARREYSSLLPPEVVEELLTIYPPAPPDEFVHVGRCASSGKDVTLCYHTFGDPKNPCMLLIMGLSCTAVHWDTRLCTYLASHGFYVIRFDNRDVGLSTHFDEFPAPYILHLAVPTWAAIGETPLPYTLDDLAADAVGLLTALHIDKAHLVGCSMGGMIAQLIALHHPERVLSLCLHSTSAACAWPKLHMLIHLLDVPESTRDVQSMLDYRVRFYGSMAGDMEFNEHEFRLGMWFDVVRSNYHGGTGRQLAAIARASDRSAALRAKINREEGKPASPSSPQQPRGPSYIPVVVLHGGADPMIPVHNAVRLADCINGAKLVIFPRMGHLFTTEMLKPLADEMVLNARSAVPQ